MAETAPAFTFQHSAVSPLGHITYTGFGLRQDVALGQPRVLGTYAIVLFLEGRGTYSDANGYEHRLVPGDFLILFPELAHIYNPDKGTEWMTSFLCFIGPVFDQWRQLGLLDSRRPIHRLHPIDLWNERLESILGSANQPGFAPPLLEVCRLQEFLAQVIAGDGRGSSHQDDLKWIDRACRLVEATPHLPPDWPSIARQLGASVASFRKRFTRFTGHAPAKYRLIRRIDRACELMQEGRLTDRQIAERLGFCDEFYFSRRFKQITGKSPRALRRTLALAHSK